MKSHLSRLRCALAVVIISFGSATHAQTTAGIGTTIVFPVTAQTTSFASEVTLFNPGPSSLTASLAFYEANNSGHPGLKPCTDITIAAARSAQLALATQCTLGAGTSHFGLLVVTDKAVPKANYFYGYMRVQNPQGVGFSVEGFPVQNFNNQVAEATGLMKQAAAPGYQTNCFVGSLDLPVSYTVKLFNGFTGSQIGGTLAGSLTAYQQIRYLDVFGSSGVNAPAGDQFNVRAEFTQTAGGAANLVGFCTVQDNTSFGADFRVAKSYGSPSGTFFAQGGNAFGTTATLGTTDNNALHVQVAGQRAIRIEPSGDAVNYPGSVNVIGGYAGNEVVAGDAGATISGGGKAGNNCGVDGTAPCENATAGNFGVIGGGIGNFANTLGTVGGGTGNAASDSWATVGGGANNEASGVYAVISGGASNGASGIYSVISGGFNNIASQNYATVGGGLGNAAQGGNSTVGGGYVNIANGVSASVAGGNQNSAASFASVGGGAFNDASGDSSTIPGGVSNSAAGANSVVLGTRGETLAAGTGSFVFSDTSGTGLFGSGQPGEFLVAASGGIGMWTKKDYLTGCHIPAGGGSWSCSSSRELKHDFVAVDASTVLSKVLAMPITTWRYKTEADALHVGPVAEDFRAAFGLGADDRSITTSDESGIALAAIQGLDQLVMREERDMRRALQQKDAQIRAEQRELALQRTEIAALRDRMTQVESVADQLSALKAAAARLSAHDDRTVIAH